MGKSFSAVKRVVSRTFWRNTFNRDIVLQLIVSILMASLVAGLISVAADSFFGKTLTTIVGEYGEFDVIVNVREEKREEGSAEIEKIIQQAFPGAKLQTGPTITGLTSFFVGLPGEYKTKETYEQLDNTFSSVPGKSGISIMTEPRVTIKGVPDGAKSMLVDRIMQIDGVLFAFRDGGSVTVILSAIDKSAFVNQEIQKLINERQIIEITFPVGSEPENVIRLGDRIAAAIREEKAVTVAENVSVDSKNNEMVYIVSTMIELKRFLTSYATQITLTPQSTDQPAPGDIIAFQGTAAVPLITGAVTDAGNILVQVKSVGINGSAEGTITQGTAAQLSNTAGRKLKDNRIGEEAFTATYRNPRQQLANALTETSKLVGQIPGLAVDTQNMAGIGINTLNNYNNGVGAIEQTLTSLQAAGSTIQAATGAMAGLSTEGLQTQLGNSSRALSALASTLQVLQLVNPQVAGSIAELNTTGQTLDSLQSALVSLDRVAANARNAQTAIGTIVTEGNSTLAKVRAFDVTGARQNLTTLSGRLTEVQQFNTPLVAAQLQYLAAAVPNMRDDEISRSEQLFDQIIGGQVIPSQRIQIMTSSNITVDFIAPVIYREAGHENLSIYTAQLGTIQQDPRAQVMIILMQVKAILAAMVALIATVLFLVLDHTAVMTMLRRQGRSTGKPEKGWRRRVQEFRAVFAAPECLYGMAIGAVLLTAIFIIAGGGIPYLPWIGVPFLGALLGLAVANNAEKISPLALDEVTAGEALGLSYDEIMREIVVPNGRPGLLQKMNAYKVKFK
ncbi:hypothetical protein EV210_11236 [Anaerospora hongkongensis]|uniref:Uncharacterized protein n=1 Tax=Anaerospora hongkongensis TaxID=244830 RepID=A0A4R1Q2Q4_9FIRM|nr:hypothetical protein [Anaerospora hongkongensis]TCL35378.1 hypothetical protein EV210_11236 [Anaerospora hongkongensis]